MWRFKTVPTGFWHQRANRVRYMIWLGEQLGCRNYEDWYRVTNSDFNANDGGSMMHLVYRGTVLSAVEDCFPEFDWLPWRFNQVPHGFWNAAENRRRYMNWLGRTLGFRTKENWCQLKVTHFRENHGYSLIVKFYGSSVLAALKDFRPSYNWNGCVAD